MAFVASSRWLVQAGDRQVVHWVRRFRETGSVAVKPTGGDYRSRLTDERDWIQQRIEEANALHKG